MSATFPPAAIRSPRTSPGFTLFEVVLAIALSAVLLTLLGTTIEVFLRSTEGSRAAVEEAQLARSILQRIAEDVRAAIRYQPQDVSATMELAESAAAFDVDSLDASSPPDPSAAVAESSASDDIAGTAEPPMVLGIYGNQQELQVDISRVPRFDEMEMLLDQGDTNPPDRPSDIKTVAYYLRDGQVASGHSVFATRLRKERQQVAGLVRRSLDRAATEWAVENGGGAMLDRRGELLAPEVVGLEFGYFDGLEWLSAWDAKEQDGLPVAVHVRIWIRRDTDNNPQDRSTLRYTQSQTENAVSYELVIHLPNALPASDSE